MASEINLFVELFPQAWINEVSGGMLQSSQLWKPLFFYNLLMCAHCPEKKKITLEYLSLQ